MKLYVALTPAADEVAARTATSGDGVVSEREIGHLVAAGVRTRVVSRAVPIERARGLADWISARLGHGSGAPPEVRWVANNFFMYFGLPLARFVEAVDGAVGTGSYREIVVVAPRPRRCVPLYLVQTEETPFGSKTLLASAIGVHLLARPWSLPCSHLTSEVEDRFAHELVRRLVLPLLSVAAAVRFVLRVLLVRRAAVSRRAASPFAVGVFWRSEAQRTAAIRIVEALSEAGLATAHVHTPQYLQGSVRTDRQVLRALGESAVVIPSAKTALRALLRAHRRLWSSPSAEAPQPAERSPDGPADPDIFADADGVLESLRREVRLFPLVASSHHMVLEMCEQALSGMTLAVGFELFSPQGLQEFEALDASGVHHEVIQFFSLETLPLPYFPAAHRFHADSPEGARVLQAVGDERAGCIRFSGSPYVTKQMDQRPARQSGRRVAYFMTQPYGHPETSTLLAALAQGCEQHGWTMRVRLHPRDRLEFYDVTAQGIIGERLAGGDMEQAFGEADLIISRTSSVLGEAIARGVPVVACLVSDSDLEFHVPYLRRTTRAQHVVTDPEEACAHLARSDAELSAQARTRRDELYGRERFDDLIESIVGSVDR